MPPSRRAMREHILTLVTGVFIALGFAVFALWIIPQQIYVPESVKIAALSPDYWPTLVSWLIAGLGVLLALQGGLALWRQSHDPAGQADPASPSTDFRSWLRTGIIIGLMLLYYALVQPLGLVLSSMLALCLMAVLLGERRIRVLVPVAVLVPVGLYYFFVKVASIPLPLGLFG